MLYVLKTLGSLSSKYTSSPFYCENTTPEASQESGGYVSDKRDGQDKSMSTQRRRQTTASASTRHQITLIPDSTGGGTKENQSGPLQAR